MKKPLFYPTLAALGLAGAVTAFAQGMPETQPNLLLIGRESVKIGRGPEHAKHEAGFPEAFEKAKSPYYYLAMTSLTGSDEAWYVSPFESSKAIGDSMKLEDKDPRLGSELARLFRNDAEFINNIKNIQAQARPDLSQGKFPDLAKARFFEITIYRIKPGHEEQFEDAAKAFGASVKQAAPNVSFRIYQVIAGMPKPTFLAFASVEDYGQFDKMGSDMLAAWNAATAEEKATISKLYKEGVIEEETNRFKVDPGQSYVSKETRAKDPDFWSPK